MQRLAALFDALDASTATSDKVGALVAYFQAAPPADDGNRQSEDGLLPEERLRQDAPPATTPGNGAKPKAKPKSEAIKTTRI